MKTASLVLSVVLLIGGLSAYGYYRRSYAREAQAAAASGERMYIENCAACHQVVAAGGYVSGLPVLFLWTKTS